MEDHLARFKSIFDSKKRCSLCNKKFKFYTKRRICVRCRNFQSGQFFCHNCSQKISAPQLGPLRHKRYCLTCLNITENQRQEAHKKWSKQQEIKKRAKQTGIPQQEMHQHLSVIKKGMSILMKGLKPQAPSEKYDQQLVNNLEDYTSIQTQENPQSGFFTTLKMDTGQKFTIKKRVPRSRYDEMAIHNQIALAIRFRHPNLLQYIQVYSFENAIFIVQQYLQGKLSQLIEQRAGFIPQSQMAFIAYEVLKGLRHIHSQDRIHRNIKSENILINTKGEIKLGDFGYAAQLTLQETHRESLVGTPSWMAPELILNQPYDFQADIWSFGILMIELAEGQPPFHDEEPMKVLMEIAKGPPPRLANRNRWSSEFCDFVSCCLQKRPENRPDSRVLLQHPFIDEYVGQTSRERYNEYISDWNPDDNQGI